MIETEEDIGRPAMTSLIEERKDCLVILSKGSIDVVPLSSYSLLKHKYYNGLPISYAAGADLRAREEDVGFTLMKGVDSVRVPDKEGVSKAILQHRETGNGASLSSIFDLHFILSLLRLKVVQHSFRVDLSRDGTLMLTSGMSLSAEGWTKYNDGSTVAKIRIDQDEKDRSPMFRREKFGIALVGRDEVGQPWMLFVPPEYANKSISDCEKWVCGFNPDDDITITF